ncbi:MAG: hypothetical protein INF43_03080 [Alphaproteobacteria bacterium]|nr:hypothetical protein [Alphaproteobacteria bacterium]
MTLKTLLLLTGLLGLVNLAAIAQTQPPAALGPIAGISESRSMPGCKIIFLRDGSRFNADAVGVRAGGTCPANFIDGKIINDRTVRLADGRLCTVASNGEAACAKPGENAKPVPMLGPIVGISESQTIKGCKIILLRDGTRFSVDGKAVRADGTCPADFIDGAIVNSATVRLADNRVCRYNRRGELFCGVPGQKPEAIRGPGPIVGTADSRSHPGCKIIRLTDGSRFNVDDKAVQVGGQCPPDFIKGTIVDSRTVRLADKRICYLSSVRDAMCVKE